MPLDYATIVLALGVKWHKIALILLHQARLFFLVPKLGLAN